MSTLPAAQTFKSGESARPLKWAIKDSSGTVLRMADYAARTYRYRRQGQSTGGVLTSEVTEVGSPTTHSVEVDVSALTPGRYRLEADITSGTVVYSPEITIDVVADVG